MKFLNSLHAFKKLFVLVAPFSFLLTGFLALMLFSFFKSNVEVMNYYYYSFPGNLNMLFWTAVWIITSWTLLRGSIRSGVVFPSVSLPAGCSWLCCKNFSPSFSGGFLGGGGRCLVVFVFVFFFSLGVGEVLSVLFP